MTATISTGRLARVHTALAARPVWQVSYLAGLAASVVVEVYGLAARVAGVPMKGAGPGSHTATPITVGMFAMGTMVAIFWFTFATVLIARFAKHPARTYVRTTLPLVALSLVSPLTAADTPTSTRLTLAVAHLLAASVVIPTVARRLQPRTFMKRAVRRVAGKAEEASAQGECRSLP